jgi:hypothetical protein
MYYSSGDGLFGGVRENPWQDMYGKKNFAALRAAGCTEFGFLPRNSAKQGGREGTRGPCGVVDTRSQGETSGVEAGRPTASLLPLHARPQCRKVLGLLTPSAGPSSRRRTSSCRQRGSKKFALIWDNCKTHLVPSVLAVLAEHHVVHYEFEHDMTDISQPIDIVVNGPNKAYVKQPVRRTSTTTFRTMSSTWVTPAGRSSPVGRPRRAWRPSFESLKSCS